MAVFNNKPTEFVDMNDLFPVLNEKVGLTYEQWRKAIENINFVKNNSGVISVNGKTGAVEIHPEDYGMVNSQSFFRIENILYSATILNEDGNIELVITEQYGTTTPHEIYSITLNKDGFKCNDEKIATTKDIQNAILDSWEEEY